MVKIRKIKIRNEGKLMIIKAFNSMVLDRLKQVPMTYEQLTNYLQGVMDCYQELTDEKIKFSKEINSILKRS